MLVTVVTVQEMPTWESVCEVSTASVEGTTGGLTLKGTLRQRSLKGQGLAMTLNYVRHRLPLTWTAQLVNQLSADRISLHTQLCCKGQIFASLQHRRSENRVSYFAAIDDGTVWGAATQLIARIEYFISVPGPQHAGLPANSLQLAVVRQAEASQVGDSYQLEETALSSATMTAVNCDRLQCTLAVGRPSSVGSRRGHGQADSHETGKLYLMRCENLSRLG